MSMDHSRDHFDREMSKLPRWLRWLVVIGAWAAVACGAAWLIFG